MAKVSAGRRPASERPDRSGMGAPGAIDPRSEAGRAIAQDRHALGDERDHLSSANRLSVAVSAAPITPAKSKASWPSSRGCGWRSSNGPTTLQGSSSCRVAGSSNEPSPGSAAIAAWSRTTRASPTPSPPSSPRRHPPRPQAPRPRVDF